MNQWILVVCVVGCGPWSQRTLRPPVATESPAPIPGINSPFDDFNSADMSAAYRDRLLFSTNRGSEGKHFDLYEATVQWAFPEQTSGATTPVKARDVKPFAPELMSEGDERGPLLLETKVGSRSRLVFASNRAGGQGALDFYSAECANGCDKLIAFRPLVGLNSPADDAYLTNAYAPGRFAFASSRDGGNGNDLYEAYWSDKDAIDNAPSWVERIAVLSSAADDTAPFVYDLANYGEPSQVEMVFVSSRPGLGEHDLYCARYEVPPPEMIDGVAHQYTGKMWSAPVHLRALSSARDEYRPIVVTIQKQRFVIFSSTREGGEGGYDLYVAGYAGCPTS